MNPNIALTGLNSRCITFFAADKEKSYRKIDLFRVKKKLAGIFMKSLNLNFLLNTGKFISTLCCKHMTVAVDGGIIVKK